VLDIDSSVSPTYGAQEGTAYNGHFACTCYHPLFVFNQDGDLERCALRPGNVHSAHGWRDVLAPVVARYRGQGLRRLLRGDAAFALPDVYEYLEAEGFQYAIRLPANQVLQNQIAHLLTRPVGRPPHYVRRFYASFRYQAQRASCFGASSTGSPGCGQPWWFGADPTRTRRLARRKADVCPRPVSDDAYPGPDLPWHTGSASRRAENPLTRSQKSLVRHRRRAMDGPVGFRPAHLGNIGLNVIHGGVPQAFHDLANPTCTRRSSSTPGVEFFPCLSASRRGMIRWAA
jgi:hypothetical protein